MSATIYLTFNDLKEDTQLEIYDMAKDEVFKTIKNEFISNYGAYIDDTHIENIDDLTEAIIKANKNLSKEVEKLREEDNEDYENEVVEIDWIVFDTFDKDKIRDDIEGLIDEEADNMIYSFNYVFNP